MWAKPNKAKQIRYLLVICYGCKSVFSCSATYCKLAITSSIAILFSVHLWHKELVEKGIISFVPFPRMQMCTSNKWCNLKHFLPLLLEFSFPEGCSRLDIFPLEFTRDVEALLDEGEGLHSSHISWNVIVGKTIVVNVVAHDWNWSAA